MKIGDRNIGPGQPVYVIAEVGSNHDGDLDQARRLIQAASEAGAGAAKFQLYRADKLYPGKVTPFAVPDEWLPVLQDECLNQGLDFLCSVFCLETLAAYEQIDPLAVKIASPEATNEELLEAASGLPMLVSTGALNWGGTDRVNVVLRALGADYALLHCVSAYPAEPEHLNLAVIPRMMDRYRVPIGLSDHSDGDEPDLAPVLAIGAGASVIEKHITLSRAGDGPDHSFALESWEFKLMVDEIRLSEYFMGDGVKRVQPSEDATDRRAA